MTVKVEISSTLNGQAAELLLIEREPLGQTRTESKTLSGGTETFIFTSLDGGDDKEYDAQLTLSDTGDVTSVAQVSLGADIRVDPIPHRDVDASQTIREDLEFGNGVSAKELGLGDSALVGGLLSAALNDGEVLADDGYVYSTVQAAQDAASSWIFVGPGTFNETVTVDTAGLTIRGSGYNTLIDGGSNIAIDIATNNVTIRDLSARNNSGSGSLCIYFRSTYSNQLIDGVSVRETGGNVAINMRSSDSVVNGCTVENSDGTGINIAFDPRCIVSSCRVENTGSFGIASGDDGIVVNNTTINTSNNSISVSVDDSIIIGNRVIGSANEGIDMQSEATDTIVANNRISDSGGVDIDDSGTGTVLDGNNTGASN